jgi:hypothetical protein
MFWWAVGRVYYGAGAPYWESYDPFRGTDDQALAKFRAWGGQNLAHPHEGGRYGYGLVTLMRWTGRAWIMVRQQQQVSP